MVPLNLHLEKILKKEDGYFEECNSATIDRIDPNEFDEGTAFQDFSVPTMKSKENVKWNKRLEESNSKY